MRKTYTDEELRIEWNKRILLKRLEIVAVTGITYIKGKTKCPRCGVFKPRIVRTMPREEHAVVRYHDCICGWRGKSVEEC